MLSPVELLESRLAELRAIAASKTHFNRKKARGLIPAYEAAIKLLKTQSDEHK